jgi:hypothetical protein
LHGGLVPGTGENGFEVIDPEAPSSTNGETDSREFPVF